MPTGKTIIWILTATVLYLIAWNVGGGWLYAIIALLVAFPLGSMLVSRYNTSGITISQECRDRYLHGETLRTTVTVSNTSRLPRFLLKISGKLAGGAASLLLVYAPGRSSHQVLLTFGPVRRGIYSGSEFQLASKAPAGLARSRRSLRTACPVVVYPRWYPLPGDWSAGRRSAGMVISGTSPARVPSSDYLGIRDYRPEDSPRSIHWKSTARSNRLTVTEYARQAAVTPVILIDTYQRAAIGPDGESSLETAVTLAATLVQREAVRKRRFGIGVSLADAAGRDLGSDPEAAMLMLAGLRADTDTPLDLDAPSSFWADVTPVVIVTSHSCYAGLGRSSLFERYPGAALLLIDGRACNPAGDQRPLLMNDDEIATLAADLEAAGCRFALIDPDTDEESWLAGL